MKIAALADQLLKNEMQQKPVGENMVFIWATSLDELTGITNADVYFDLEFVFDNNRIDELKKLLPKPIFINSVVDTLNSMDQPFIRINAWPGFLNRNICEAVALD
jgi:3-hydroxybutyryl-CoA dehydrogenase